MYFNKKNKKEKGDSLISYFLKKNRILIIIVALAIVSILVFSNFTPTVQGKTSVYQILSDYQDYPNGGDGYLRIMTFDPIQNQIEVTTFSPYLNSYKTGAASNFNLSYSFTNPPQGTMPPVYLPFTIIVLPDTQYYSSLYPQIFMNQTNWILQNRQTLNIQFVIHLGDLVDSYTSHDQWTIAYNAMNILRSNNIPFSILPGNHDYTPWEGSKTDSTYYYFATSLSYSTQPSFGGSLNNDYFNSYSTFSIGYDKYLILNLEFDPSIQDMNWANQIIHQNPNTKIILATHDYLTSSGRSPSGEAIWNSVVKPNMGQCQIVLCGHNNGELNTFNSIFGITESNGEKLRIDKV